MSPPSSNASYESLGSVSAHSTMSVVADDISPTSNTVMSFYQKSTMVTGRPVRVKHPKRGQASFVFQQTTKTEEMVIQTTATAPSIMLIKRDQGVVPEEQAPAPVVPVVVPATAAPRLQEVLTRFFVPKRGFVPNRGGIPGCAGPSRKRARRPSVADAEHAGRKYIFISDGEGGHVKNAAPAVERNLASAVERAAIPANEHVGELGSPLVLVEDSDGEEFCTLRAPCDLWADEE
ncbi:hypothetical protein BJ912DRAFT_1068698 [Pholiota molesta]|nr:hypothetical protein BJ912DRAFT_1068698 [Pholiota molesta]